MLQCTPAAAAVLEDVRRRNDLPDEFGVRIATAPETPEGEVGFRVDFAKEPIEGDQVSRQHGTLIMVAPEASELLDELALDVVSDPASNSQKPPELVLRSQGQS